MAKAKKKEQSQAQLMAINARAEMAKAGLTIEDIAYVWGCSLSSAYRRLRMPEKMTVGELELLARTVGVPCSALFGGGAA